MAQMSITNTFAANTLIRSAQMNTNFITNVRDTYNAHDTATTAVHGMGGSTIVGTALAQTLSAKILTAPDINGGTADSLTSLSIRNTAAAFDILQASTEAGITANRTITWILGNAARTIDLTGGTLSTAALPPVGSIIAHYDFGGMVALSSAYVYCDGSVIVNAASPINGQTLPDLSNRYLVGFGTEGGGNIDTDPWLTPAVGNASHQVNLAHTHTTPTHSHTLSAHTHTGAAHTHTTPAHAHTLSAHTHTGPSHTHTGPSHTHTGPSHTHTVGTLRLKIMNWNAVDTWQMYKSGSTYSMTNFQPQLGTGGSFSIFSIPADGAADFFTSTADSIGATSADGTGATGASGTGATGASGTGATGVPSSDTTDTSGSGTSGSTASGAGSAPSVDSTDTSGGGTSGSGGSATQDVQPRSIRVRFAMRIV